MLVSASWCEDLRRELGVTGVSPLWDGGTGYYFWIDGAQGPFQLQLRDSSTQEDGLGERTSGVFSIKCYPRPDSAIFGGFSAEERDLVHDSMFDDTGTPRFEAAPRIGPDLFVVGVLEVIFGPEEHAASFILESADRMIVRRAASATGSGEPASLWDRNVPGWEIGYVLFHRLVAMWAAFCRSGPSVARLSEDEGFETILGPDGQVTVEASRDSKILSLEVRFGSATPHSLEDTGEIVGRLIYEFRPDPKCAAHVERLMEGRPFLNSRWWTIPLMDYKCSMASTCGCE
jgi:hypothetical protein